MTLSREQLEWIVQEVVRRLQSNSPTARADAARGKDIRRLAIAGRLVTTLVDGHRGSGGHAVIWDGRDDSGRMSAAGVYLYRLEAANDVETMRMVLVK